VLNNPVLCSDPTGQYVVVGGETKEEREARLAAIKHSLRDPYAASHLTMIKVGSEYRLAILGNKDEFKAGTDTANMLGIMIGDDQNKVTFNFGALDDSMWRGGRTLQVKNSHSSDITIDAARFPRILDGLWQDLDTAIQHELGHAFGYMELGLDDLRERALTGVGTNDWALSSENRARALYSNQGSGLPGYLIRLMYRQRQYHGKPNDEDR
jgi:hypothetical protein